MVLKEESAERYLPIWIGPAEAEAIAIKLQGAPVSRPLTHDLICQVIESLGVKADCVVITELKDDIYYAKIILNADGEEVQIDSRPSDALALAVRARVPIFTEEQVLDEARVWWDKETGRALSEGQHRDTRRRP